MKHQLRVPSDAVTTGKEVGGAHEVRPDVAYLRTGIVNVVFIGPQGAPDRQWALVDTGLTGFGDSIRDAAAARFGPASRPAAILLTHGHFDHVGNAMALAEEWRAPIIAHPAELPFLNGQQPYSPPDTAAGGLMSALAGFFPRGPVDLMPRISTLLSDGEIRELPDWRWIHTPGHTPGHVSLWRAGDRTLIAGDAFITTRQESLYSAITQDPEMHGPPMYFTPDWDTARESVRALAALAPDLVVTGHGRAMTGPVMRDALTTLAERFDEIARPSHLTE